MEKFRRLVETASNVAIIALALLLGSFLIGRFYFQSPAPSSPTRAESVQPGGTLLLNDIDWGKSERNLVMVLSTACHFCTESMPFYQRLAKLSSENNRLRLIASFPQDVTEARKYLQASNVGIEEVIKASPSDARVRGTPTLILTDNKGVVLQTWIGKLTPEKENEVAERVFSNVVVAMN